MSTEGPAPVNMVLATFADAASIGSLATGTVASVCRVLRTVTMYVSCEDVNMGSSSQESVSG